MDTYHLIFNRSSESRELPQEDLDLFLASAEIAELRDIVIEINASNEPAEYTSTQS